jgi:homoserine O-acetyltransferase
VTSDFYSEALKGPHEILELGDLELELGGTLPGARLAYKTHGTLNEARDNAILYPHMYASTPSSLESAIAAGRALDPASWYVICPGMLAGGFSSSPSNTPPPNAGADFPELTIGDDVTAQHRLVTESLGVERLALVVGFSMGAQQAYEWAVRFPGRVARLAAIGGTARTTAHNGLVVGLAEAALGAGGPELHAQVWATLGLSHELWRTEGWRELGFTSPDDLVRRLFTDDFAAQDPHNLAAMCRKWRRADVGRRCGGDLAAALGSIQAATAVIPLSHDQLFPVADCEAEARQIPGARVRIVETPWGHWGFEATAGAREGLDAALRELLATPAQTIDR